MIHSSMFADRWPRKRLGDVVDFLDSMRKPVRQSDRVDGPYPYYGANGKQGAINDYIFDEPLILLAEDGGHFGDPKRTIAYGIEGKTWVNNHAHVLRPKKGVDFQFLLRQLEYYDVRPLLNNQARPKLNKAAAEDIEVCIPTGEAEQHRIAAILDKADAIRRKRQQAIDLADEFLRSVFLDMFGDPVTNPKGWKMGTIRDLVDEVRYGTSSKAGEEGEFEILRMGNITYEGGWDFSSMKRIDIPAKDQEKYLVQKGDLLFNRTNSKELVGKTSVYREDNKMAFAGYLVRMRANDRGTTEYVSAYMNSSHGKQKLRSMCKSIVGMANINAQEFQDVPIALAPFELQQEFDEKVEKVLAFRAKLEGVRNSCADLFGSLSQRAFAGEL